MKVLICLAVLFAVAYAQLPTCPDMTATPVAASNFSYCPAYTSGTVCPSCATVGTYQAEQVAKLTYMLGDNCCTQNIAQVLCGVFCNATSNVMLAQSANMDGSYNLTVFVDAQYSALLWNSCKDICAYPLGIDINAALTMGETVQPMELPVIFLAGFIGMNLPPVPAAAISPTTPLRLFLMPSAPSLGIAPLAPAFIPCPNGPPKWGCPKDGEWCVLPRVSKEGDVIVPEMRPNPVDTLVDNVINDFCPYWKGKDACCNPAMDPMSQTYPSWGSVAEIKAEYEKLAATIYGTTGCCADAIKMLMCDIGCSPMQEDFIEWSAQPNAAGAHTITIHLKDALASYVYGSCKKACINNVPVETIYTTASAFVESFDSSKDLNYVPGPAKPIIMMTIGEKDGKSLGLRDPAPAACDPNAFGCAATSPPVVAGASLASPVVGFLVTVLLVTLFL